MIYINSIDTSAKQNFQQLLENGEYYDITLAFIPFNKKNKSGDWFMSIKYNDLEIEHRRVCANISLFEDYANILPYRILVLCPDFVEPYFAESFSSGNCKVYIITKEEYLQINV